MKALCGQNFEEISNGEDLSIVSNEHLNYRSFQKSVNNECFTEKEMESEIAPRSKLNLNFQNFGNAEIENEDNLHILERLG